MPITKTYDMINYNGVKGWIRDSWARRKIADIQTAIAGITVPTASTANPQMDGTAAPGVSTDYARADHVHPSDTTKQDTLTTAQLEAVNSGVTAAMITALTTPEQVTGTTDGNGNLKLFNGTDKHVFAAWGSNNVCVPFVYNSNTYVAVFKTDSAHTSVRSTSVTVNYIAV